MTSQTVHDPVCHMDIDIRTAAGTSEYGGKSFYFCSGGCKADFDRDPDGVLKAEAEHDHSQPAEMTMPAGSPSERPAKKPWWRFWG